MDAIWPRIAKARSRGARGPDALELGCVSLIVAVASVIAIGFGLRLMQMTQSLDAVALARGATIDAIVYHAEHGRWPPPGDRSVAAGEHGVYAERPVMRDSGVITGRLTLAPKVLFFGDVARGPNTLRGTLAFRPELLGSKDAPSIAYLCGHAAADAGAIGPVAADRTTIPRAFLPPSCR